MSSLQVFFSDPNVAYLVLLFGLWVAVTAAYIPGTGLLELLAVGTLIFALVILNSLPTNWWSVLVLVLGVVSFLLVPFLNNRLATLAQGGLVLQAVGGALLFNGLSLSWLLIGITIIIALLYHNYALLPILRKARQQNAVIDDDAQLIGAVGRVVAPSKPFGNLHLATAQVRGEHWSVASDHALNFGDEVVVLAREGLQLTVKPVKMKLSPQQEEEVL